MSIPVIALTEERVTQVAQLHACLRFLNEKKIDIEREQREQQGKLDDILRQTALSHKQYETWAAGNKGTNPIQTSYRYVPTLSEDGRSVVIIKERTRD